MITELGFDVISSGGYKNYILQVKSEKEFDNEIKQLNIKQLKGNILPHSQAR